MESYILMVSAYVTGQETVLKNPGKKKYVFSYTPGSIDDFSVVID